MAKPSTKPVIERRVLERLGAIRLKEAKKLLAAGCYSGAIHLGGYAAEFFPQSSSSAAHFYIHGQELAGGTDE